MAAEDGRPLTSGNGDSGIEEDHRFGMRGHQRIITHSERHPIDGQGAQRRRDIGGGAHAATFETLAEIVRRVARQLRRRAVLLIGGEFMLRPVMHRMATVMPVLVRRFRDRRGSQRGRILCDGRHRVRKRDSTDNQGNRQAERQNEPGNGTHGETIQNAFRFGQNSDCPNFSAVGIVPDFAQRAAMDAWRARYGRMRHGIVARYRFPAIRAARSR